MITTKQKVALAALVPVCAAVWGPQLLTMLQGGDESAQVGVSGPTEAEMMELMGEPGANADSKTLKLGGGSGAESFTGGSAAGPDRVLDEVLRALSGAEAFRAGPGLTTPAPVQGTSDGAHAPVGPEAGSDDSPAMRFAAENPLRGTLTGESGSYALMGSYRLKEGDRIPGTQAVLIKVERGEVTVEEDGHERVLVLPPLRTDPTRGQSDPNDPMAGDLPIGGDA